MHAHDWVDAGGGVAEEGPPGVVRGVGLSVQVVHVVARAAIV